MDNKEVIMQAAIAVINEKGEQVEEITVREICKRANVGLGLVNYHFGSKEKLVELCVERIVNGVVENFLAMQEQARNLEPLEKLNDLGNKTWTFLFEHYAVSRISILSDMNAPKENDNTHRTYCAYLPLVSACRPDWDEATLKCRTFCLITTMQQLFLRHKILFQIYGIDLTQPEERQIFHSQMLHNILGV